MTRRDFKDHKFIATIHVPTESFVLFEVVEIVEGNVKVISRWWNNDVWLSATNVSCYPIRAFKEWSLLKGYNELPKEFLI